MRYLHLAAALALAVPAFAQSDAIAVGSPWARATTASAKAGGVFLTLTGVGAADELVGASSPVAGIAEVHRTVNENGVMKMLPVPALALPAGVKVELKPGGYHIMLFDLKQQLKPGETFPLTLRFANAAAITTTVTVAAAGAAGPAAAHYHPVAPKP